MAAEKFFIVFLVGITLCGGAFITGADMSALPTLDCDGTCSPYKANDTAEPEDALKILAQANVNTIRLRIWNDPDTSGEYCNLKGVKKMAKRVTALGLKLHLDFHFSDTWADPGHQFKPAKWADYPFEQLRVAVYNYTRVVMYELYNQKTPPTSVQIGNEIDNGMLWPEKGQDCSDSGSIQKQCPNNEKNFAELISAGLIGVADAARNFGVETPQRMIHIAKMNGGTVKNVMDWFEQYENNGGTDFEVIGLSFYEAWGAPITKIPTLSQLKKPWVLVETSHPYYPVTGYKSNFPFSPQGQSQFAQATISAVKAAGGAGVFWWGTEYYTTHASQWSSLWDEKAIALPALFTF